MVETCPTCNQEIKNKQKLNLDDIQKTIKAWKILNGIPVEGEESKAWNKAHFHRLSRTARSLLLIFKTPEEVLNCMDYVIKWCEQRKLDFTFETILKRSDLYLEVRNGKLHS